MPNHQASLAALVSFYETLTADNVRRVRDLYADDAFFKDPFNEVRCLDDIERIFVHMFRQVDDPRFVVTTTVLQGEQAFLAWNFHFRMRRWNTTGQCIRGATQIRFAPDGRVTLHRDYWDTAEELYEKLPVLGGLMRWLKGAARG